MSLSSLAFTVEQLAVIIAVLTKYRDKLPKQQQTVVDVVLDYLNTKKFK